MASARSNAASASSVRCSLRRMRPSLLKARRSSYCWPLPPRSALTRSNRCSQAPSASRSPPMHHGRSAAVAAIRHERSAVVMQRWRGRRGRAGQRRLTILLRRHAGEREKGGTHLPHAAAQRMTRRRGDSWSAENVDPFLAMPLCGGCRGRTRDLRRSSVAPEKSVIGGDHQRCALPIRDLGVAAEKLVDLAEVTCRNAAVAVVVGLLNLRLFRRCEWREDVANGVGSLQIDDRQVRKAAARGRYDSERRR